MIHRLRFGERTVGARYHASEIVEVRAELSELDAVPAYVRAAILPRCVPGPPPRLVIVVGEPPDLGELHGEHLDEDDEPPTTPGTPASKRTSRPPPVVR